jgi:hypothetical protein
MHKKINAFLGAVLAMLLVAVIAQAVTTTDYTGDGSTTKLSANSMGRLAVLERTVTCSTVPMATSDVYQLFDVPENTLVLAVSWEVTTTNNVTATFDIGDGSDPDGFIDGASADAVAAGCSAIALTPTTSTITYLTDTNGTLGTTTVVTATAFTGYTEGKYYEATDTIDLTARAGLTNLVLKVRAVCVQLER